MNLFNEKRKDATILCLIDLSEPSMKAVEWAISLSQKLGAHLTVIYPYRLEASEKTRDAIEAKRNQEQKASLDFARLEQSLFKNTNLQYDLRTEIGFAYDRIEEHARKQNILFAVVQKKFMLGKKELLSEVLEKIQIPLVIVP